MTKQKLTESQDNKSYKSFNVTDIPELLDMAVDIPHPNVVKCFDFCYGHFLPDYIGKCANQHGHNVRLEVEVSHFYGRQQYPSMTLDFRELKDIVKPLIELVDHKMLNDVLPQEFLPATTENLCRWFWFSLELNPQIGKSLQRIKISETGMSWAEITRTNATGMRCTKFS